MMWSLMRSLERDMKAVYGRILVLLALEAFPRHDRRPVPKVITHDFGLRHLTAQPPRRNLTPVTV